MTGFSDFDGLAIFVRTVQAGSLAAAERATGVPKATLSRRLTALEQALNVTLARRTRKGLVLTERGQRLFDRATAAVDLAEQVAAEASHDDAALSGTVRISLPPDIGVTALAPALIRFKGRHAGVVVDVTFDDRRVSLVEEGYDLVVRVGRLADSDLLCRRIAELGRTLVASPDFLADHLPPKVPDDLHRLPAIAVARDAIRWEFSLNGDVAVVHPRIEFAANRHTVLVDAAIAGVGVGNLPTFLVEDALLTGRLVRVLPAWETGPVELTALWQRHRITSRLVSAIVKEFVGVFDPERAE